MTFDEWWKTYWEQTGRPHLFADVFDAAIREVASKAWNAAIEAAAKTAEAQMEGPECPERAQYCADAIRTLVSNP